MSTNARCTGEAGGKGEPTRTPAEQELLDDLKASIRAEARSAYLGGAMDKHHPDL